MVFATPGMLHAGQSLQIFKKWAGNEKNMVSLLDGLEEMEKVSKKQKDNALLTTGSTFLGHHAWVLCTRNHWPQDPKWAEETGDGRKSNSKPSSFHFKPRDLHHVAPFFSPCEGIVCLFVAYFLYFLHRKGLIPL